MNFTVANMVKRVYHIIREECHALKISLKDHHSVSFKGGKHYDLHNIAVPKDVLRMDSLKSISLSKRQGAKDVQSLDQIDEDEDDEGASSAKATSALP
jgi:hypothetical protein